ncbi:peroxiredoxin [bacterium]|nr:MAG: peroxiredoxin [bacterium]
MEIGSKAPNFTLLDQNEKSHSLKDLAGKHTLIYFYPKDDTPGCTTQACSLRDSIEDLRSDNIEVLGVSADSVDSHKKFAEKYNLPFPVLSNPEKDMIEAYHAWGERSMYGRKFMGIIRSAVLISPDLTIEAHWPKIQPLKTVPTVRAWMQEHSR